MGMDEGTFGGMVAVQELQAMEDSLQAAWEEERAGYEDKLAEAESALADAMAEVEDKRMETVRKSGAGACRSLAEFVASWRMEAVVELQPMIDYNSRVRVGFLDEFTPCPVGVVCEADPRIKFALGREGWQHVKEFAVLGNDCGRAVGGMEPAGEEWWRPQLD
jgi:hypothetical protein